MSNNVPVAHRFNDKASSGAGPRAPLRWQPGGVIGEGAFGKVLLAMNTDNGELMAVKQVSLNQANNQQQIEALQREIELLQVQIMT